MLKFNILTLFPEVFPGILQHGLLGKALSKNHFEINTINIRDYSDLSANSVDDKPFSGGAGMVLRPDIISKSIEANVLAPFQYLEIIGATFFGFWLFADFPTLTAWLGISIIVLSGIYVFKRETMLKT